MFDHLCVIDRPEVVSISRRVDDRTLQGLGFGYEPGRAPCKLVEPHPFLSFNTRCAGSDMEGSLIIIPRRKDNEGSRPPCSSLPEKTGIGVKIDTEDSNGEPDMWHSGLYRYVFSGLQQEGTGGSVNRTHRDGGFICLVAFRKRGLSVAEEN
jgi:hypothetical protein